MNNTERLTLLDDNFSYEDAKELLSHLFASQINFYNIKNWGYRERFGKNDEIAQKRILALKKEMQKLQLILLETEVAGKEIFVTSEISIKQLNE